MRGAVWTALLTVSAVKTRHACYSTADAFITAMVQLVGRYRPAKRKTSLIGANVCVNDATLKGIEGNLPCSVDVAAGGAGLPATSSNEEASHV